MNKINRKWFANRVKEGKMLVKCRQKLTDDYAYDYATNYGKQDHFEVATPENFSDWYIKASYIWGDKDGTMTLCFANSEYYECKVKN